MPVAVATREKLMTTLSVHRGDGLRIAVLVKQVPISEMNLGPDGRLVRDGAVLELGAYCRRAVAQAVALAAAGPAASVTVLTLGPPTAEEILREAVAWGADHGVDTTGLLVSDPAFAGSDTIATSRVLAEVLRRWGPFDLVLAGKQSLDADTGHVPVQVAELLDLPFVGAVRQLGVGQDVLHLGCEHDDHWVEVDVALPAVLSCAERLCPPAKVDPERRAAVPAGSIRVVTAAELGAGPWGAAASPTRVGAFRHLSVDRSRRLSPTAPLVAQVDQAVDALVERGALVPSLRPVPSPLPETDGTGPLVAAVADRTSDRLTRELCAVAARLAHALGGGTALIAADRLSAAQAGEWGADHLVRVVGAEAEEDVARAVARWAGAERPWAILAGSTPAGREVAARVAAATGAGLTGDAVELEVADGRLVAWKAAFGGQLTVAITAVSTLQMATLRPGVVPLSPPRGAHVASCTELAVEPRRRVLARSRRVMDASEALDSAEVVVGVGVGVDPAEYDGTLRELCGLLNAERGCTRRVADQGWMPHSRQIGITGRSISPRLYVAVGTSGRPNHMAGVRSAGTVLAVNPDPDAEIWRASDVGIVAPWQLALPLLVEALRRVLPTDVSAGVDGAGPSLSWAPTVAT